MHILVSGLNIFAGTYRMVASENCDCDIHERSSLPLILAVKEFSLSSFGRVRTFAVSRESGCGITLTRFRAYQDHNRREGVYRE
jgi:hypothetical protein